MPRQKVICMTRASNRTSEVEDASDDADWLPRMRDIARHVGARVRCQQRAPTIYLQASTEAQSTRYPWSSPLSGHVADTSRTSSSCSLAIYTWIMLVLLLGVSAYATTDSANQPRQASLEKMLPRCRNTGTRLASWGILCW